MRFLAFILLATTAFADNTNQFWNIKVASNTWTRVITFSDGTTLTTAATGSGSGLTTNNVNGLIGSTGSNLFLTAYSTNIDARVGIVGSNAFDLAGTAAAVSNAISAWAVSQSITNGLATRTYAESLTNGFYLASNPAGYVTQSVTNGLQVAGNYVTASITNGLATQTYAASLTNGFYLASNPAGYVTSTVTNGLQVAGNYVTASVTNGLERALTFSNNGSNAGVVSRSGDTVSIGTQTVAAASAGGATNLVLNQARWTIVGASTATRAGSDYRWLQMLSNSTVYALEVVMPSTWTNKQSITIHSIAPSGVATNTFALYSMPCDTTTNIPTAWTATNFVTAISGVVSTSNLVTQIGAGLNCLMLSNQTGNASTNWISNVEFRFSP